MRYFTDIAGVIESYSSYLGLKHPDNRQRFENLRASNPEGAMAEAVVFRLLQTLQAHPELHENASTGGADFMCTHWRGPLSKPQLSDRFIVEATSLDPDAVTDRSNLPNEISEDNTGGAFGMVTQNIFNKVRDKASQLADYPMPRVLAIASSHAHISLVFNGAAAQWALVSDIHWRQDIGSNTVDPHEYTDLRRSIFMKPGPGDSIVACRQSVSAVLLVAVEGDKSEVWGILHPEPAYALPVEFLPRVPFIRIAHWPIVNGRFGTEWIVGNPRGFSAEHVPVYPGRTLSRPPVQNDQASEHS